MENGPPTIGLEDGAIDVEHMLVEPQDEHLSMDSVMCFNEKNLPNNAMDVEDVSHSSGGSDTGIAQDGKDNLNGEVLNAMPGEVGYFRLDDDFSSMGEEYLLGVEFAESITNLDYGSSEGLQASVSESQIQVSSAGSDTACKSDLFRTVDVQDCQNDQFNVQSTDLSDTPTSHECKMLVGKNFSFPTGSRTLQNITKLHSSSRSSFEIFSSDENDSRFTPASEMLCSPKTENDDVYELTGQDGPSRISQRQHALAIMSVKANCTDILPTQKRSRKPTQRYIDELIDPIPIFSKKRREFSSTRKERSHGAKDLKKCHMGPKAIIPLPEESSVIAIQVPFASLGNKEYPEGCAYDTVQRADTRNLMTKSKGKGVAPQNQNKTDKCGKSANLEKMDDFATIQKRMEKGDNCATIQEKKEKRGYNATIQKKMDGSIGEAQVKKRNDHSTAPSQKKRNDCTTTALIRKKRGDCFTSVSQNKRDKYTKMVHHKKIEDCGTAESSEEVSGRRKHHRLWTIAEVRKLIDGVSQYGVGRWSRIKKLFFSTSAHRTSVDLKDKWRNLLKASGMQDQGNQQGEKKRNLAWRPLPKSILRRVCELATMYPYPKGQRPKISHIHRGSPDRSADITLSDYRRILRSISAN